MRVTYFGAEHCPQCRVWSPKFKLLCEKRQIPFNSIDVDEDPEKAALYGVRGIPYALLEDDNGDVITKGPAADVYGFIESMV